MVALITCIQFVHASKPISKLFTVEVVEQNGVNAELYLPETVQESIAVLVLGGSSGRLNRDFSERLASHGFISMSLAYFNAPGLPTTLDNIPIETVSKALDLLQNHPLIKTKKFGVLGVSRGSELAFLSAINDARLVAVVGIVPSAVAWHGQTTSYAWTHQNQAVPTLSFQRQSSASVYERALLALESQQSQLMPFEKIKGSILLISASNDHIWPSKLMANQIEGYLNKKSFRFSVQHLSVDDNHFLDATTIEGFEPLLVKHFRQAPSSEEPAQ